MSSDSVSLTVKASCNQPDLNGHQAMETASEELGRIHSPLTMRSDHVPQHHLEDRHSATGDPEKVRKDANDSNKTEVTSDAVKNMGSDLDQLTGMNYFFPFLCSHCPVILRLTRKSDH